MLYNQKWLDTIFHNIITDILIKNSGKYWNLFLGSYKDSDYRIQYMILRLLICAINHHFMSWAIVINIYDLFKNGKQEKILWEFLNNNLTK